MHSCGEPAEAVVSAEIRLAEINAKRDVEIARIQRGETKIAVEGAVVEAELETEAAVEEAVVKADVLDELLAPEPEPEPVVVVADETAPAAEEAAPDDAPPEMETAPASSKASNPWW
jgi:DNA polymerase III gamma/tau subunit